MDILQQIQKQLEKTDFPDLKLIFSEAGLEVAPELLNILLRQEKDEFETLLLIDHDTICFDDFEDEGILDYYWSLLNHFGGVHNTQKIRDIIEVFRPKLQDFSNYVSYHTGYYELLLACNQTLEEKFTKEDTQILVDQKRAMKLRIKAFVDRGISLPEQKQERLKELSKILSKLSTDFSNNIVDDEETFSYEITDFEIIKDLPVDVLESVKKDDTYTFTADPTGYGAIMKYCSDAVVRKDFATARNSFASDGKFDNRENILNILQYKQEQSQLLGYKNYAELSLHNKMADTPEQIFTLVEGILEPAKAKAIAETELLKNHFGLESMESYDLAYYSNIYKKEKYNLDEKELQKYFLYENVLQYLHNFVKEFYDLELKEIESCVYDESVKVFEVYLSGELISYYLLDPFYRKEKRGGAWADNLREKNPMYKKIPVVVNVCNFLHASPTLLLMRDVETLFHEFGHAIHEMLSASTLSELSGFGVEWDFVELPSQLLENWVSDRASLEKLAKHHETGEALGEETLNTLESLETYMSGHFVVRQNEFALLDMSLYSQEVPKTIEALDQKTLELVNKYGVFQKTQNYKMYCSFGHIFGGGYAAGYYSYMWAEILEADVFERIKELGMFDPKVGKIFLNTLLAQGSRKPAEELFQDFMGRSVDNKAFMKRKGL